MHIHKTVTGKIKGEVFHVSTPKTKGSDRLLPIESETLKELQGLHEIMTAMPSFSDEWFVFGGIRPLAETSIAKRKNTAIKKAGLKNIRIHDFRHSCASYYIHLGAPIMLVSKLLGHAKVSTTLDVYAHLYPSELENIFAISDKFRENNVENS